MGKSSARIASVPMDLCGNKVKTELEAYFCVHVHLVIRRLTEFITAIRISVQIQLYNSVNAANRHHYARVHTHGRRALCALD